MSDFPGGIYWALHSHWLKHVWNVWSNPQIMIIFTILVFCHFIYYSVLWGLGCFIFYILWSAVQLLITHDFNNHFSAFKCFLTEVFDYGRCGASDKEPSCQCRRHKRHRFDSSVMKIPWRRKWQTTPVFLPGESHGQRSLTGYSPWGRTRIGHNWNNLAWTHQIQISKRTCCLSS